MAIPRRVRDCVWAAAGFMVGSTLAACASAAPEAAPLPPAAAPASALPGGAPRVARAPRRGPEASDTATAPSFYDASHAVPFTLTANFNLLRRDRQDDPPWRTGTVTFADSAGDVATLPVRVRARGRWRRDNCQLPPLRLDFVRRQVAGTPFDGVNRPKLVQFCQDHERGERYVLHELQLYRIYQLFTTASHRARLVRVTYADSGSGRVRTTRHGFLLEEQQALARRLGAEESSITGHVSEDLDPFSRVLLGVFQYFIGNTDWSTAGLHNVELFVRDGVIYPVAYDFDHSGAVNADYATPPPQVRIRSVRERAFRGACGPDGTFEEVFAAFRANRAAIYALYGEGDAVGRLIDRGDVRRVLRYFDEFYAVIDDPRAARREILERCAARQ